jgi:hypothetical protein
MAQFHINISVIIYGYVPCWPNAIRDDNRFKIGWQKETAIAGISLRQVSFGITLYKTRDGKE